MLSQAPHSYPKAWCDTVFAATTMAPAPQPLRSPFCQKPFMQRLFLNKELLYWSGQRSLSVPGRICFRCWQAFSCTWKFLSLLLLLLSSLSWQKLPQTEVTGHWYDFALFTIFIIQGQCLGTAPFSKFMSKCLCYKQLLFPHRTDLPQLQGQGAPYRFSLTVYRGLLSF